MSTFAQKKIYKNFKNFFFLMFFVLSSFFTTSTLNAQESVSVRVNNNSIKDRLMLDMYCGFMHLLTNNRCNFNDQNHNPVLPIKENVSTSTSTEKKIINLPKTQTSIKIKSATETSINLKPVAIISNTWQSQPSNIQVGTATSKVLPYSDQPYYNTNTYTPNYLPEQIARYINPAPNILQTVIPGEVASMIIRALGADTLNGIPISSGTNAYNLLSGSNGSGPITIGGGGTTVSSSSLTGFLGGNPLSLLGSIINIMSSQATNLISNGTTTIQSAAANIITAPLVQVNSSTTQINSSTTTISGVTQLSTLLMGTTTPISGKLAVFAGDINVSGTIDPTRILFTNKAGLNSPSYNPTTDGGGNYRIEFAEGAGLNFKSASTSNILHLMNNGNVGVGTSTPGAKLHVYDSSGHVRIRMTPGSGTGWDLTGYTNSTLSFNNGADRAWIDSGGNMTVTGSHSVYNSQVVNNTQTVYNGQSLYYGTQLIYGSGGQPATRYINSNGGGRDWRVWAKDDGEFYITDETAGQYRLKINQNGDIQTTGPITANGTRGAGAGDVAIFCNDCFPYEINPKFRNITYGSGAAQYSIIAESAILADQFSARSDERLKSVLGVSTSSLDLENLSKIVIKDYYLKDDLRFISSSSRITLNKKVIAQELEKVEPNLVSRSKGFIPTDNSPLVEFKKVDGKVTAFQNGVEFVDDKKYKYYMTATHKTGIFENGKINDIVPLGEAYLTHVEVNDLRTVDYDGLTTLAISSLQEVNKKISGTKESRELLNSTVFNNVNVTNEAINEITSSTTLPIEAKLKALTMKVDRLGNISSFVSNSNSGITSISDFATSTNVETFDATTNSTTTTTNLTFFGRMMKVVIDEVKSWFAQPNTEVFINKARFNEVCIKNTDGTETCMKGDQFRDILNKSSNSGTLPVGSAMFVNPINSSSTESAVSATSTPSTSQSGMSTSISADTNNSTSTTTNETATNNSESPVNISILGATPISNATATGN